MDTPAVVWIGLSVYLLVMLGIGVASSRRNHDTTDYIVAGHQLSFGLCTFTLFATWFGIALLVGSAGAAYEGGFRNVISEPFGGALCLFLCGLFIFGVVRRLGFLTLSELFRVRYGRHAEGLASLCLLAVYLTWVTAMFAAFGDVLHGLSGLDRHWAIGIAALIVTAYTAFGGMWAVSLTDSVQAVILLAGLAYLFPVVLGEAGGWRAFATTLPASYFDFLPDRTLIDWLWHVQAWTVIGLGAIPDQALFQRASAARDARTARNSALLAAGLYLDHRSTDWDGGQDTASELGQSRARRDRAIDPVLAAGRSCFVRGSVVLDIHELRGQRSSRVCQCVHRESPRVPAACTKLSTRARRDAGDSSRLRARRGDCRALPRECVRGPSVHRIDRIRRLARSDASCSVLEEGQSHRVSGGDVRRVRELGAFRANARGVSRRSIRRRVQRSGVGSRHSRQRGERPPQSAPRRRRRAVADGRLARRRSDPARARGASRLRDVVLRELIEKHEPVERQSAADSRS